jgi:tetratricopeptide (TPR) repeat protein
VRPDFAEAHIQRGDAPLALRRPHEAIEALRRGIELKPDRPGSYSNLARAMWLGLGDVDGAIEQFEHMLRLNPEAGYTHLQLAMLYTFRGDHEAAETVARNAIRLQDQVMSVVPHDSAQDGGRGSALLVGGRRLRHAPSTGAPCASPPHLSIRCESLDRVSEVAMAVNCSCRRLEDRFEWNLRCGVGFRHHCRIRRTETLRNRGCRHRQRRLSSASEDTPPRFQRLVGGEDHWAMPPMALVDDMEEHIPGVGAVCEIADFVATTSTAGCMYVGSTCASSRSV